MVVNVVNDDDDNDGLSYDDLFVVFRYIHRKNVGLLCVANGEPNK